MNQDEQLKILITEGSSGSAKETVYCIGDRYDLGLLDAALFCQCRFSKFVRRVHRCPHFASRPAEYLQFLISTVRSENYDVLFPVHEQVYLLSRVRERIAREVAVAIPDFDTLRVMQSKSDFVRVLSELEIPIPETRIVREFGELHGYEKYPCYIKLAHSTAGTGVALVHDKEELAETEARFDAESRLVDGSEILVQQPASGIMCVVQAVFQNGEMIAAHCAETLWRGVGGGQGFRVSASHPKVVQYVRKLGEHLGWHGPMFLEYFYDPNTGEPRFIECNPRIGETFNAKLSGIDLCELIVRISLGEKLEPIREPGKVGVRSYTDFHLLLAYALNGDNRRTILREALQMLTGRGKYQNASTEITRPREDPLSLIPAVATFIQLLIHPGLGRRLVNRTVGNYSLPQSGVDEIHRLSDEQLAGFFEA